MRSEAKSDRLKPRSRLPRGNFVGPQGEALISILETIGDFAAAAVDPHEPTPAMKALLLRHLQTGSFLAFGVLTKPQIGQAPQAIPVHFFKGKPKIDWRLDNMENLGQRFEVIEVVRAKRAQLPSSPESSDKRRGRPSVGNEIAAVIREFKRKQAFETLSEKQRVALVQAECHKRHPKLFPKPTQPSKTKVRELLAREGV